MPDTRPLTPSANALHYSGFVCFWLASWATAFAVQIMSVAVSWQIYDLTGSAFYLGMVGLVQFMPALVLVLVTGWVADRFNRRLIMMACLVLEIICALGLMIFTMPSYAAVSMIFATLGLLGFARAFLNPAADALSPNLVPQQAVAHSISLSSMSWQVASIAGPAVGGLLYGWSGLLAYGVAAALVAMALVFLLLIGTVKQNSHSEPTSISSLLAGFRFIWSDPIVLGAISLDLFAVLLGGAVALMPIFARDILHTGPFGLGLLRSAPAIGAVAVALWLSHRMITDHAGKILFLCVAGFGATTIVFGLSTVVWLSVVALILMGACDMVSVYVRKTLMQLRTPDAVRGRVNAVNRVFIGASNEVGEFRAGMVAAWVGAVAAVTIGGIGTIAIAGLWSKLFPALFHTRKLDGNSDTTT